MTTPPQSLCAIARDALTAHLARQRYAPPMLESPWDQARGAFVTLWSPDGSLRGCIGHLGPTRGSLAEEVADCAVAAGTADPRFRPVQFHDVPALSFEVSVLDRPEPARREDLDPHQYGVIVSLGHRRGVLLPDIDGVDTVEDQLRIALRKGNIGLHEPYAIERFTVHKVTE